MKIESTKKNKFQIKNLLEIKYLAIVGVIVYSLALMYIGAYIDKDPKARENYDNFVVSTKRLPRTILHTVQKPKIEKLEIDIKHKNLQQIAFKRKQAIEQGFLESGSEDYVKAKLRYKDENYKIKMRLKGIYPDHWIDQKHWSFRIKVRDGDKLWGIKDFSLVIPKTRDNLYEWIFTKALAHENLIAKRYKFIEVVLNGENLGLYAFEEHFSKELIENSKRREGPIIGFNEDLLIKERIRSGSYENTTENSSFFSSYIQGSQINKMMENPSLYKLFRKSASLLEAFRRGELAFEEVFDVDKTAKLLALKILFGSIEYDPDDTKFYYNPITSRLEPIGSEVHYSNQARYWWVRPGGEINDRMYPFIKLFFSSNVLLEKLSQELERISKKEYLDEFLSTIKPELKQNISIFYSKDPRYVFNTNALYKNQRYIAYTLDPVKGIHAYFDGFKRGNLSLKIGNLQEFPIEVLGVSYKDSINFNSKSRVIVPAKDKFETVSYEVYKFSSNDEELDSKKALTAKELLVSYKVLGLDEVKTVSVFPWTDLDRSLAFLDPLRSKPNAHKFKFLEIDKKAKVIYFKPGNWAIRENLIIPPGYTVGNILQTSKNSNKNKSTQTKITLRNKANIISYSALDLNGTEEEPMIIESIGGQGLVVLNTERKSKLNNVIFKGLSNPVQSGWELPGAVSFHEADVHIYNTRFANNKSEDSLNIVRSNFIIKDSSFINTFADAFDSDFSNGEVQSISFYSCGNDCLDASGSKIDVIDTTIIGAGDKGISAGENSLLTGEDIHIEKARIGVASKDKSRIEFSSLYVSDSKYALSAYQKKAEFGPGTINLSNLNLEKNENKYLIEEKSKLFVDKKKIKLYSSNVYETLEKQG